MENFKENIHSIKQKLSPDTELSFTPAEIQLISNGLKIQEFVTRPKQVKFPLGKKTNRKNTFRFRVTRDSSVRGIIGVPKSICPCCGKPK